MNPPYVGNLGRRELTAATNRGNCLMFIMGQSKVFHEIKIQGHWIDVGNVA